MRTVYLSLGSNLGNREEYLRRALAELSGAGVRVKHASSIYETEPVGVGRQPRYLNIAVEAETDLFPMQLLGRLQTIERRLGRRLDPKHAPRTIDIDILLYGDFTVRAKHLTVPHPRMSERRFVLEPLAELAPELRHPVSGLRMRELLGAAADRSAVRRLGPFPVS